MISAPPACKCSRTRETFLRSSSSFSFIGIIKNYDFTGRIPAGGCIGSLEQWAQKPGPGNQAIKSHGAGMRSKRKIWLGVGVVMVAGTGAVGIGAPLAVETASVRGLQPRFDAD